MHIIITVYISYSHGSVGSALARLERSTLQEHNGTRTIVLLVRFLKIIAPVECVTPSYDGYIQCPQAGELYRRAFNMSSFNLKLRINPPVWSINLDRDKSKSVKLDKTKLALLRGLQLLWDT